MVRGCWGPPHLFSDGSRCGVRPRYALRPINGRGPSYQDDGQPLARIIQRAARGATVLRNPSLISADERGVLEEDTKESAPVTSSSKINGGVKLDAGYLRPLHGSGPSYWDDARAIFRFLSSQ
ncbi:hypothetical protein TWF225_002197 [Orbilia oligospora]|nr:hypothetical protein TWF225_002197 [Orbilia oligospora]KAF3242662.1 hypothetical protein TWF217_011519 [Orbilia oligospora]KAF3257946.1 hypothetical protein TWF128_004851 [Orbilia oligospora]KAF3286400.1 hypothetical protein TWF132_008968 [Orbilia oligospora]